MAERLRGLSVARREPDGEGTSGALELFYDLVFAFTITQVSHLLIGNLGWQGAVQASIVLLGAWWSWNYTTWFTDEMGEDSVPIRLLMVGLMAASLLMAISVPEAFGSRGLLFAGAAVAIQVIRHTFLAFAAARPGTPERERALHILIWFIVAGVFWIGGALVEGQTRIVVWIVALLVDYGAPRAYYPVPGRPRLTGAAWTVNAAHFSDRYAGFIILTLGETIAITGAMMTSSALTLSRGVAFVVSFLGSAAFWWLYFARAREAPFRLSRAEDQTGIARDVFTYAHAVLVAGILLAAVGDEFVLTRPLEALPAKELVPVVLGPVLFLLAQVYIDRRIAQEVDVVRLGTALALIAVGAMAAVLAWPALLLSAAILALLVAMLAVDSWRDATGHAPEPGQA